MSNPKIAFIGGSGFQHLSGFELLSQQVVETAYGQPSSPITLVSMGQSAVAFLPRHGEGHVLAPHKINYRANIQALKQLGVEDIVAVNAVGGIHPDMMPGSFVVPHQLIDYTYGREQTFFDGVGQPLKHIEFSQPYSHTIRQVLYEVCRRELSQSVFDFGVYGCTQGPRLETAAEIAKLKGDGCDIVGMTSMPEAALARELGINYATLCIVVNWCAGIGDEEILLASIMSILESSVQKFQECFLSIVKLIEMARNSVVS